MSFVVLLLDSRISIFLIAFSFLIQNMVQAQTQNSNFTIPDSDHLCSSCPNSLEGPKGEALSFYLSESAFAAVIFMDANGKVVRTIRDEFKQGLNTISISEFKGKGLLYYTLETRGFSETKKVNLL